MDERIKFVSRLLEGESMAEACREYNISRKTGYKFYNRYKEHGLEGFVDKSRRPLNPANKLARSLEEAILSVKQEHASWGARKIREILRRKYSDTHLPATSTVHAVLDRHGLVNPRKRRRIPKAEGTRLSEALEPNDVWCADFKGEFKLKNNRYCYPLTITDNASRYLLTCESLESTSESTAFPVFERTFREYGLPKAIRTDNGVPFANPRAVFQLSHLSVFWLRLGIRLERITPGMPQQNGRHERMHRTLKSEATKPPATNLLSQQEKFDLFTPYFNLHRPHEALDMKFPNEVYRKSDKQYQDPEELQYPQHQHTLKVYSCGSILYNRQKIYVSKTLANQLVGINMVDDGVWAIDFMDYQFGFFDAESKTMKLSTNPFI